MNHLISKLHLKHLITDGMTTFINIFFLFRPPSVYTISARNNLNNNKNDGGTGTSTYGSTKDRYENKESFDFKYHLNFRKFDCLSLTYCNLKNPIE